MGQNYRIMCIVADINAQFVTNCLKQNSLTNTTNNNLPIKKQYNLSYFHYISCSQYHMC